ncbi:GspE/PulE family protein [Pseudomethylobacillus aquaticus]|uniref:GspE/PulE family protein n=1 Tax=Pseudomethylobacillus aquaticus TaxID=2676064 RepID=A0A3N0UZR2_9PROT|nr:GspE/PulE family protein [Pseudomethylobacillus aquaticus]ROH85784.1 GspE/PulE family protein [Pseudomethylobacillus aquaticus]
MRPFDAALTLGQQLLQAGHLSPDQLQIALQEQTLSRLRLGEQLLRLGFISEALLTQQLAAQFHVEYVDLDQTSPEPQALAMITPALSRQHHVLGIRYEATQARLSLAISDMPPLATLDRLQAQLPAGGQLELRFAAHSQISRYLDQHYGYALSLEPLLAAMEQGNSQDQAVPAVAQLVEALLLDAVKRGASDIHFEPEAAYLRLRYRIDGVLQQVRSLHKRYWSALLIRLKVISGLDIAETRAAQDGHLHLTLCGRNIDFRVASHPTIHGENLVLRVLDREKSILSLAAMGLPEATLKQLQAMLQKPEGMLIFTGPTGSGKTSTLYSLLALKNSISVNIMTLEDPVEYPVSLLRQTSLSEAAKLDFSSGIRSLLRQDPDVILVGEMRDAETAQMALRAAMTGHQVYSTLHSNSALGAFARLQDLGLRPALLAGNLIGIVAQRLIRKLCLHCRGAYVADTVSCRLLALPPQTLQGSAPHEPVLLYRAVGCTQCQHTGYRGRLAIMEVLKVSAALDRLIEQQASLHALQQQARTDGLQTLASAARQQVLQGVSSLQEVMRVVDLEPES